MPSFNLISEPPTGLIVTPSGLTIISASNLLVSAGVDLPPPSPGFISLFLSSGLPPPPVGTLFLDFKLPNPPPPLPSLFLLQQQHPLFMSKQYPIIANANKTNFIFIK